MAGRRWLGLVVALGLPACTIANPAFGLDGSSDGGGDSQGTGDTSVSGTDASSGGLGDASGSAEGSGGDSSTGGASCELPAWVMLDATMYKDGDEVPPLCGSLEYTGQLLAADDTQVQIRQCADTCPCDEGADLAAELHGVPVAPLDSLLGSCVRMVLVRRTEDCAMTIFAVATRGDGDTKTAFLAVQSVDELPGGLVNLGSPVGFELIEACACTDCCDQTGRYGLRFDDVLLQAGESAVVPSPYFGAYDMDVTVHAAHIDETCLRDKVWSASLSPS
ncbi:MAG: hypothetical protein U0168_14710 [Nannocystaceae bacterium]